MISYNMILQFKYHVYVESVFQELSEAEILHDVPVFSYAHVRKRTIYK